MESAVNQQWLDITQAEYHAYPAISSGGLRLFESSGPLEYWAKHISDKFERTETDSLQLGTALHLAMERQDWRERYVIMPATLDDPRLTRLANDSVPASSAAKRIIRGDKYNGRLETHRNYMAGWQLEQKNQGNEVITQDQYDKIEPMVQSVRDNPACWELFEQKQEGENTESICTAMCRTTSLPLKAMIDLKLPNLVIDYKTTRRWNHHQFYRDVDFLGYHYQVAYYQYVAGLEDGMIIAIRNEWPFVSMLYEMSYETRDRCHQKNIETLAALAQHYQFAETDDDDGIEVPVSWRGEGWGAALPLTAEEYFDALTSEGAEVSDYGGRP